MSLEEKISMLKRLTIYVFIFCFIITTAIASIVIYFFISNNSAWTDNIRISSLIGLLLSTIITYMFYRNFKLYDRLEHLVSDLCVDNKQCLFKTVILLLVHFDFVKDKLKTGFKKEDICKNDDSPCDSCTRDTCLNCDIYKGVKK